MATDNSTPVAAFAPATFIPGDPTCAVVVPPSAHTLDGFRKWALSEEFPERGKMTFVGGELIIDMSPEYFETHNFIKTEITSVIYGRTKARAMGRVYSDRALFSNEAAGVSTEPDAMFAAKESLRTERCKVVRASRPGIGEELVGSPDWVLEILSSSSRRKDTTLLREAYFRAGIPEYWIVDALGDDVELQILVAGEGGYVATTDQQGWLASPAFACSFRLTRKKDDVGYWMYTLQVQESA